MDPILLMLLTEECLLVRCMKYGLISPRRFLITGSSFCSMAFNFRMGKTTISKIVSVICKVIWDTLQPDYMPVPTEEMIRSVADADKKFLMIDVGGYGKQHDASIFRASTLFQKLEAGEFPSPPEMTIPDTNITLPTFLIADKAYPLLNYLMRPYSGKMLTPVKDVFNKRLSRARKCIECAFCILTRKFQVLMKSIETKEQTAIDIIKCACVLHNFIRTKDGESDLDYRFMVNKVYDLNMANTALVHYTGRRNNPSRRAKEMRDTSKLLSKKLTFHSVGKILSYLLQILFRLYNTFLQMPDLYL